MFVKCVDFLVKWVIAGEYVLSDLFLQLIYSTGLYELPFPNLL